MRKNPIFIHSLFRTGSTYVWNKFRQHDEYYCYYEPFHQEMASLEKGKIDIWGYDKSCTQWMRHPDLNVGYLREYEKVLEPGVKGVPFFKKSFSFDNFFNNAENPDQKKYIDFLLESAGDRTPVLQFNRSSLRISWFKRNYPDALHLYLMRGPRDQFHSYIDMYEKNKLDSFLTMDLIVTGVNRHIEPFNLLSTRIPLFEYHSGLFLDEKFIYSRLLPVYSADEKYYIFYFIWFLALIENVHNADFILNIDLLSRDTSYRDEISRLFEKAGFNDIDFSDAGIGNYKKPVLRKRKMTGIEMSVQSLLRGQYEPDQLKCMYAKLGTKNRQYLGFDRGKLRFWGIKKMDKKKGINKELLKKYELIFNTFSAQLADRNRVSQLLKKQLANEMDEVLRLKKDLEQKERELTENSLGLDKKEQQLLQEKEKFEALEQELKEKELQLEQKDREISRKDEALAEKDRLLEQKSQQLAEKDLLLERNEQTLAEKDRRIMQESEALAAKEQQLASKAESLEHKDRELKEKDRTLEQKDRELKQKDSRLESLSGEQADLARELSGKNKEIDSLKSELSRITGNKYFKALEFLKLVKPDEKEMSG